MVVVRRFSFEVLDSWLVARRSSLRSFSVRRSSPMAPLSSCVVAAMCQCVFFFFCRSIALVSRMTVMNLNSVEKAYLHLSVALLCNSFVTVKNTFDTTFFLFLCFSTVPGNWSSWGDWSPCSKTCGNGTITRTRTCDNPAPAYGGTDCVGAANMTKDCLDQLCPGQLASFDLSLQLKDRDKLTSDALRKETLSFYRARNQSNMCHPLKKT